MKISVITPTIRPESLSVMRDCLKQQTFKDFEWLVDINVTGQHDLNNSFNKLIRRSNGELVVFYEDYTKIPPNALEKWWKAYQEHPNVCWTAPLGKVKSLDFTGDVRWDWRAWVNDNKVEDYRPSGWQTCELDWGAIPRKVLYEIGGFDERLDQWWSCDNLSLGKRAYLKGYEFKNFFANPALAYDHDAFIEHPFRSRYNPKEVNEIMASYTPETKLPYLS
jgi:hypothetical protein